MSGGPNWDFTESGKVSQELDQDRAAANERDREMMAEAGIVALPPSTANRQRSVTPTADTTTRKRLPVGLKCRSKKSIISPSVFSVGTPFSQCPAPSKATSSASTVAALSLSTSHVACSRAKYSSAVTWRHRVGAAFGVTQ
jgi:hypothetical protein